MARSDLAPTADSAMHPRTVGCGCMQAYGVAQRISLKVQESAMLLHTVQKGAVRVPYILTS